MNAINLNQQIPVQQMLFKDIYSKNQFIDEFRKDPITFLKRNGIDTSELQVPKPEDMPSKEVMLKRLDYYMNYDEFGKPAKFAAFPFIVLLVFLIPGTAR